jgi:hypothetical protein
VEDITIHIPGLVEQSDNLFLFPGTEDLERSFADIRSQWWHLTTELNSWFTQVHEQQDLPFWEDEPRPQDQRHDFGTAFAFPQY